jgi:hypothetical protein
MVKFLFCFGFWGVCLVEVIISPLVPNGANHYAIGIYIMPFFVVVFFLVGWSRTLGFANFSDTYA